MKPSLGWTMLSRDEMRQVERSLANSEQDTRDEIGFLLLHQGFADRFFPGTSVLHTRIRYALFIPWLYQSAATTRRRGNDIDATIGRLLIELAIRLKQRGEEPTGVIGGDKLGQLTSQPPDRSYWSALREWKLLRSDIDSRSEALRRLEAINRGVKDDDGGWLEEANAEVFTSLPTPPEGWDDGNSALHFRMPRSERDFLRRQLRQLTRATDGARALLARLVDARVVFSDGERSLPLELNAYADVDDRVALNVARDAAAIAAVGRAVYGALVEEMIKQDGGPDNRTFRDLLPIHVAEHSEAARRCDLDGAEKFLPALPPHVRVVLRKTQEYVRNEDWTNFETLKPFYRDAEVKRKSAGRARLVDTPRSAQRRSEWDPARHNITPLHYRWEIVRDMLTDLNNAS